MNTPNTLNGLRATLESHARIVDTAVIGRRAEIHHRVRVVRRRRRAASALGAVAALLAVVAGIALPSVLRDRGSADLAALPTLTIGGFDYRLVEVVESKPGQRSLHLGTPRGGSREAFALLAEHLDGGSATLRSDNVENRDTVDRIVRDGANPAVPIFTPRLRAGTPGPYRLEVAGGSPQTRVGVAIYERTSEMPTGVVDPTGTTVFRDTIGSRHLLHAAFARPGQAEVTFRFTGPVSQTAIEGFCSMPEVFTGPNPVVNVSIDGGGPVSWGGCSQRTEDAASGGFVSDNPSTGEHVVRVWTSTSDGGPARAFSGAILGGAAYDDSAAVIVNGNRVDPLVEYDGHTWALDRDGSSQHRGSGHRLVADYANQTDPVLFSFAADKVRAITATTTQTVGDGGTFRSAVEGPSSSIGPRSLPGPDTTYTLTWPAKDTDAQVSILVYRLVR